MQVEQELERRQARATIHGDEEFHADIDLQVDFSDGMEFLMVDRHTMTPTPAHNWGELVDGRPNVDDTRFYSWEQLKHALRQRGRMEELDGKNVDNQILILPDLQLHMTIQPVNAPAEFAKPQKAGTL